MIGMKLDRIEIEGYRSIRKASVGFKDMNILIGPNGAGKSNLLSVFTMMRDMVSSELQLHVSRCGISSLLYNGPDGTHRISVKASFGDEDYGFTLVPTDDGRMMFSDEYLCQAASDIRTVSGEGHFESKYKDFDAKGDSHPIISAGSWCVYHFHDTSKTSLMRRSCSIHDDRSLMHDAGNIAPFLLRLKEEYPQDYRNIVRTVRTAVPFFEDFELTPNVDNDQVLLRWRKVGHDGVMGSNQLSDGTLRFICLTTLLLQPKALRPMTMIIDEPELGLFPQAMVFLAEMMKSVSRTSQLIVSTQSVDLVDEFDPCDMIMVRDEGHGTEFSRLDPEKLRCWLDDGYTLGLMWKKNLLNGDY